jgi:uncharacterized protein YcbX
VEGRSDRNGAVGSLLSAFTGIIENVCHSFRPNIVVIGAGIPFAEDAWQKITIGTSELDESKSITLVSKCARCLVTR